jgi:flagellar motor switch protein FliN/FliY
MAELPDNDNAQEHEPGRDAVTDAAPATPRDQATSPDPDAEAQDVFQAAEQRVDGTLPTDHAEPEEPTALQEAEPSAADASAPASTEAVPSTGDGDRPDDVAAATEAFNPPDLTDAAPAAKFGTIDLLDDVELDVKIELGRTEMYIEDVIRLGVGSVVELDKLAGDPVDVYVNERLVARGEVLVLNDNFCVRINDILSPIPELESA